MPWSAFHKPAWTGSLAAASRKPLLTCAARPRCQKIWSSQGSIRRMDWHFEAAHWYPPGQCSIGIRCWWASWFRWLHGPSVPLCSFRSCERCSETACSTWARHSQDFACWSCTGGPAGSDCLSMKNGLACLDSLQHSAFSLFVVKCSMRACAGIAKWFGSFACSCGGASHGSLSLKGCSSGKSSPSLFALRAQGNLQSMSIAWNILIAFDPGSFFSFLLLPWWCAILYKFRCKARLWWLQGLGIAFVPWEFWQKCQPKCLVAQSIGNSTPEIACWPDTAALSELSPHQLSQSTQKASSGTEWNWEGTDCLSSPSDHKWIYPSGSILAVSRFPICLSSRMRSIPALWPRLWYRPEDSVLTGVSDFINEIDLLVLEQAVLVCLRELKAMGFEWGIESTKGLKKLESLMERSVLEDFFGNQRGHNLQAE